MMWQRKCAGQVMVDEAHAWLLSHKIWQSLLPEHVMTVLLRVSVDRCYEQEKRSSGVSEQGRVGNAETHLGSRDGSGVGLRGVGVNSRWSMVRRRLNDFT